MRILKYSEGIIKMSSIDAIECEHWSGSWRVYIHYSGKYTTISVSSKQEGLRKIDKLAEIMSSYENKGTSIINWRDI